MTDKDFLAFIKDHQLMLLATVHDNGKPQAAVVEFGEFDDLTIIFDTHISSRKYENLKRNPNVAAVIGWDDAITVQLEGVAEELTDAALAEAKKCYFAKNPKAEKWGNNPNIAYFAIKPHWLRYTDLNQHPWLVHEFSL